MNKIITSLHVHPTLYVQKLQTCGQTAILQVNESTSLISSLLHIHQFIHSPSICSFFMHAFAYFQIHMSCINLVLHFLSKADLSSRIACQDEKMGVLSQKILNFNQNNEEEDINRNQTLQVTCTVHRHSIGTIGQSLHLPPLSAPVMQIYSKL